MTSKKRRRRKFPHEFWHQKLRGLKRTPHNDANLDAIRCATRGDAAGGARMVVNISSAHIPSFCNETANAGARPYKNIYDLQRLGVGKEPSATRRRVDTALPLPPGKRAEDMYFGAVEISGTGIRFYGDICLVLKPTEVEGDTLILETNSYDLEREPLVSLISRAQDQSAKRRLFAKAMSGRWDNDRGDMVASKVFQMLGQRERLFTLGQIAEAVRDDEDYVEVIRAGTFDANDLEEVRLQPEDAAVELRIAEQLRNGMPPSLAEVQWGRDRRRAEMALRALGIPVRVVTTPGRTKTT
ncbi:MAG: hypothetical protein ABJE95_13270 [Byssovorax sp.]